MWEFFIRNNKFSYLFLVALIATGTYSVLTIAKESSPEVIVPVGVVTTVLPGAPAADVETLVTNEIERGLTALSNVKEITSTSREGVSSVVVEFDASADVDESIQELKDEVDTITPDLPDDAEDPFVSEVNFVDQPVLTFTVSGELTAIEFTALADEIETEIEAISGVSRLEASGVRDREVSVIIDQTALEQFGLNLSAVTSAIRNANLTFPIGQIVNNGIAYNVAFEGDIADSSQIASIGVAERGGQPVFLRDIATIEDALAPASSFSRVSVAGAPSQSAISFDVYKQSGGDITAITSAVNSQLAVLSEPGELLDGLTVVTVLDAGQEIVTDLVRLSSSGFQTVLLVVLLLVVVIGWREGLLAGTAIPLSFLFGFIGLYLSGNTINFLSLFSLILGIGILVDSAIVMIEGINRRMKDDPTIDKKEAAIAAIKEFNTPLISGTLTTVSMFVGLFIVSGVIGQFISSIPFTLIFLLFASLFVALAILPLLASGFLRRRSETRLEKLQLEYTRKLEAWYRERLVTMLENTEYQKRFLALIFAVLIFAIFLAVNLWVGLVAAPIVYFLLRFFSRWNPAKLWMKVVKFIVKPVAVIGSIVGVFMVVNAALPGYSPVKVIFFEQTDVDYLIVEIENPEGTTKEVTDIDVRRVEEVLYDETEISSFVTTVGSGSAFGSGGIGEKFGNIFLNLSKERERTSTEIMEDLRLQVRPFNDVKVTVNQPSDGPPTGAAILIKFLGDDLGEITRIANEASLVMRETQHVVNVETSTNNNNTEFVLNLDRAKATALGLDPFTISQIARTAIFGADATSLTTIKEDINVVVKLNVANDEYVTTDTSNVATIGALEQILLPTTQGSVPLSTVVDVTLRESSSVIEHEDSKRVVTVTADVSAEGNVREVQDAVLTRISEQIDLPAGVIISTGGGETDESNKAFAEMGIALIVGIMLMVGVLTLQFNSYRHMMYVLSILPYSLIGIMGGLAITQSSLSFPSMMGFIALSGIVVNNSILLIDMMNNLRRANPAKPMQDVVLEAAGNRLRPILLTTLTTVIGMIPLTTAGDLWAPLAYAVMFGLVFSVVITLVLIPIIYLRNPGTVS